jgi:serine/threonine protein kinase/tetratricopeptide (TPR) repeat protein
MDTRTPSAKAVFDKALEMESPAERQAYLDAVCAEAPTLRQKVEALLKAYAEAGSFLESPAAKLVATVDERPVRECPGTVIGPYKLLEQIGEGGFGVVFVAEQQQPLRRKVALKVLKPGMDTRQVIARFEAERQALALMDHPNIARVFDGGTTGEPGGISPGRPYFIMELVKGIPITDYCDQTQLTPRERLELFLPVCQAVQHAHQKGIIHRDLKPSNVLVTLHDGTPVPKIIDFGIAKALGQQLTDKTLYTGFAQLVGTPLYMSPEQAALSGLDVDTRSDIYSLGVLLYELLTGTTPFDKERLHQAGYDELRRIIREEEPPKPSTRISTLGQAATPLSTQRKSDPKRLSQLFRGELDWIVMKCLEKDRNRRYETANGLARDIERYLRDEPVQACPPSAWYRLRKFGRRNKAALITAALLAGILVLGTLVSTWQAFRATQAEGLANTRLEAETEAKAAANASALEAQKQGELAEQNANAVKGALGQAKANLERADQNLALALEALDDVYMKDVEDRILRDRQMTQAERESLEKGLKFYEQFAQQNSGHAELERVTAKAYRRAGYLRMELGDWKQAEAQFTTAIPVFEKLADQSGKTADLRQELARCLDLLSQARINAGLNRKAEPSCRQAVAVWQKLVDDFAKEPSYRVGLATSLLRLGMVLAMLNGPGGLEEAEKLMCRALGLYKTMAAEYPGNVGYRREVAVIHHELNHYILCPSGRRQEAVEHQQQAVAIFEARAADSTNNLGYRRELADYYLELGQRLNEAGQVAQAEEAYHQGLRTYEKLLAESPSADYRLGVGWTQVSLGNFFLGTKRPKKADEAYRKALDVYTKLISDSSSHPSVMWRLPALAQDLAKLLRETGQTVEADAVLRQAADHCLAALRRYDQWPADRNLPGDPWEFMNSYRNLGHLLKEVGRFQEAAEAYQRGLRVWEKVHPDLSDTDLGHWQWLVRNHIEVGRTLTAAGKREESESAFRKAAEVLQQQETQFGGKPEYRRQLAESQASAAQDFHAAGRYTEAEKCIRQAIHLREELAAESPGDFDRRYEVADAYYWLFSPLWDSRHPGVAEEANRKARDLFEKLAKDFPEVPKCAEALANCHLRGAWVLADTDRLPEAEAAVRQSLSLRQKLAAAFPKNDSYGWQVTDAYNWLGEILRRSGKLEQAIDAWRQSLPYYEKEMAALNNPATRRYLATRLDQLGDLLVDTDRLKEAEESYQKALPIWQRLVADFNLPDDLNHFYSTWSSLDWLLGELAEQIKKDTALPEAERKGAARAYAERANKLRASVQSTLDEALPAVRKAIELEPDPPKAQFKLAKTLAAIGRRDAAGEAYRKAIALKPDYAGAHNNLGNILYEQGKLAEALAEYRKALAADPKCAPALWNLSRLLANGPDRKRRDPRQALELAQRGLELEGRASWWQTLGWAHYRTGAWKESIAALEKSIELNKGGALADSRAEPGDLWLFLAMAHWQLGHRQEARQWYDRAVEWIENHRVELDKNKQKETPLEEDIRNIRAEAAELMGIQEQSEPQRHRDTGKNERK